MSIEHRDAREYPIDLLIGTCWMQEAGSLLRIEEVYRNPRARVLEAKVTCLGCETIGRKRLSRLVRLIARCAGCDAGGRSEADLSA